MRHGRAMFFSFPENQVEQGACMRQWFRIGVQPFEIGKCINIVPRREQGSTQTELSSDNQCIVQYRRCAHNNVGEQGRYWST